MACRNNPGYQAFIRKVLRVGLQDLKLDVIHFDQMRWPQEPFTCRCKYCQEQFRGFLRSRYQPVRARLRFGFSGFDGVIPPPYDLSSGISLRPSELRNPLMQEWARFRAWSLAQRYREYDQYIHELNPEAALISNPTMNLDSNIEFTWGVDLQQLLEHGDAIWSEERNLASWTADGLVSMIRAYKAARSMGQSVFRWQPAPPPYVYEQPIELRLSESVAYNNMNLGVVAGSDVGTNTVSPVIQRFIDFLRAHSKELKHTESIADVAVLRSFSSIEFNPAQANVSTVLFEQSLIQSKVPFAIIFDRHLKDLSKYKVLVLANQDALSDDQLAMIRKFVEGGGLVATENMRIKKNGLGRHRHCTSVEAWSRRAWRASNCW